MTNNPDKVGNLEDFGVHVAERVPLTPHPNDHNLAYLLTKRDRMGHDLPDLDADATDLRERSLTMGGHGAPDHEPFDASDLRVAVVAASWHTQVMDGLVAGAATRAAPTTSVDAPRSCACPGTFELPVVAAALAAQGYDAVVALGVVIRGGTPHFDYVCTAATDGLTRVALDHTVAVGLRRAHLRHEQQALDRAGLDGLAGGQGLRGDLRRPAHRADPGRGPRGAHAVGLVDREDVRRALGRAEREGPDPPRGIRHRARSSTPASTPSARSWSRRPPSPGWPPSTRARSGRPRRSASCCTTPRC